MWSLIFAVVWLFVEGLGVPLLSEGAFGPLAMAVATGAVPRPVAFLFAWAATCAGNGIGFFIFWRWGPGLINWLGKRWPAFEAKRNQVEPRVRVQLYLAMTVARFLGLGTFQVVLWLAGAFRTRWQTFLPYLFFLNLIWTAFWLYGSEWVVKQVLPHLEGKSVPEIIFMGVLTLVVMFLLHKAVLWVQRNGRVGSRGRL